MKIGYFVSTAVSLLLSTMASAEEIIVLAAGATEEIFAELVPQFEKSSGQ